MSFGEIRKGLKMSGVADRREFAIWPPPPVPAPRPDRYNPLMDHSANWGNG